MTLRIGDKLRVLGALGLYHYGVYVGPCGPHGEDVVHNDKTCCVQLVPLWLFAGGGMVEIVDRAPFEAQPTVRDRALSLIGTQYDLVNFNCEHAANYILTGFATSPTVRDMVMLGVIALVIWGLGNS